MVRHQNPSGYIYYDNETELCQELELHFLPMFFDAPWSPIEGITKEIWLDQESRIDYFGYRGKRKTYVEVKNWWVTSKNIFQFLRYWNILSKKLFGFDLCVICGGINQENKHALDWEEVKIYYIITKDIKELNPQEVVHWM